MSRVVLVSHGTRDARGRATVTALADAVRERLPGRDVVEAFVDVQEPRVADVARADAVVVPLLLSPGLHVRHDVLGALAGRPGVAVTDPLGAGDGLVPALLDRARAVAPAGAPLVLAAAGSRRPQATADVERVAVALAAHWGGPVVAAHGAAARPGVPEVLAAAGEGAVVVPYLLAEGFFLDRLAGRAAAAGAPLAGVLGAHPAVVGTVVGRVVAAG